MSVQKLGDLEKLSVSFPEMVAYSRSLRDVVFDKATEKAVDMAVEAFAPGLHQAMEGIPKDLDEQLGRSKGFLWQWIDSYIASGKMGSLAANVLNKAMSIDVGPDMENVVEAIADLRIRKAMNNLILVSRANQFDVHKSELRIVKPGLTYYRVKTQSNWSGTLAEFYYGNIWTGLADPTNNFVVYLPGKKIPLRGDFKVTRLTSSTQ